MSRTLLTTFALAQNNYAIQPGDLAVTPASDFTNGNYFILTGNEILLVQNTDSVAHNFTAGYDPDPTKVLDIPVVIPPGVLPDPPQELATQKVFVGVPQKIRIAIMMLVNHWYFNREPVVAGGAVSVPNSVDALLASEMIFDFSPTRG